MMMMITVIRALIKMMQKTHLLTRMCITYTENRRRKIPSRSIRSTKLIKGLT